MAEINGNNMRGIPPAIRAKLDEDPQLMAYFEDLHRKAYFDDVTGLPMEDMLLAYLKGALADINAGTYNFLPPVVAGAGSASGERRRNAPKPGCLSVVIIDTGRLNVINNTYGRGAGDEVLRYLATICKSTLRPRNGDFSARAGRKADDFTLVLPYTDEARSIAVCLRFHRSLRAYDAVPEGLSSSAGIRFYDISSEPAQEYPETLFRDADTAMTEAKRLRDEKGKDGNNLVIYRPDGRLWAYNSEKKEVRPIG